MVIVTEGKNRVLGLIQSDIHRGGFGTGSTNELATDTGVIGSYTLIAGCDGIAGWSNEEDGEAVVLNNTQGQFIGGSACLNIPFTAGGTFDRGGWYKTLGATYDLTNKYLYTGFFVNDKTELTTGGSCVRVYLGTAGFANSSYWNFDRTGLYSGWQYLECDIDSPDGTVGAGGTMTEVTRIKLQAHSGNVIGGSDMRMDEWHYLVQNTIGITSTLATPSFTSADKVLKISHTLNSVSGNYYELAEFTLSLNSGNSILNRQAHEITRKDNREEWQTTTLLYIE